MIDNMTQQEYEQTMEESYYYSTIYDYAEILLSYGKERVENDLLEILNSMTKE